MLNLLSPKLDVVNTKSDILRPNKRKKIAYAGPKERKTPFMQLKICFTQ